MLLEDDVFASPSYHKNMKITQHLLITGRVQGVSFRFFTEQLAHKLHVTGWVRNLSDGRVEAMAQGTEKSLKELVTELHLGPQRAEVHDIEVHLVEDHVNMKEFSIVENSEVPWSEKS